MAPAILYTAFFLFLGTAEIRFLLPRHRPISRIWLGLCLGLLEEMWLPAICAFLFSFTVTGHIAAIGIGILLAFFCWLARDRRNAVRWDEKEDALLKQVLCLVIPLTLLGAYLQYTHTMRTDEYGNWNVGQSTYGDLPMHMSFVTSLVGKRFPADYPFFPGSRLSYPFLADSLSSTFYLFGCDIRAALILPGTLMMALVYLGAIILAGEMTTGKKTVILAALLFFLNGGLGFLYDFDLAGGLGNSGRLKIVERVEHILTGYYKTPTNQPDPNNLRWSNVICDMMIPQRTLLGGWCMLFPCFYLLEKIFRPSKRDTASGYRGELLLGIWGGALPLIHTHSFLALALASLGTMLFDLLAGDPAGTVQRRTRRQILLRYAVYGTVAAAAALPQLFGFTFRQALQNPEGRSFITFQFNWVNNPSGSGMRDLYFWFYLKNIGIPFAVLIAALSEKDRDQKRLFTAAFPIILAAELIRFQPNEYDNNKLFYPAWLYCCMIVSNWLRIVWQRLKGMRSRNVIAVMASVVFFFSAGLTIWRECVSDYQAFSAEAVETGIFVRDHTDKDDVFLTGTQHLNPVLSIAGRTVVCGPDVWLYWHGFDTAERNSEIALFYEDPENGTAILNKYGVDYIYVSSYERSSYNVDMAALDRLYPKVFTNGEATVYQVPEG